MTEIPQEKLSALETLRLEHGAHHNFADGACAMEIVAWLAGEPHSDSPKCASKVISAFVRSWNDSLDDERRQILKPYLPRLLGTAGPAEIEDKRAWMAVDWLVREYLPAWLDLAKLTKDADQVRALPEITSATIAATMPTLNAAQRSCAAARDAARAAACAAARAAAWAAAWDAARAAAWAAAWDAAREAARAAAWEAAWDAARAAEPTVEKLQASALQLLERMIEAQQ